jgi:hypothetical protein
MSFYDLIFLRYKINKTQVICITSGAGTTSAPEHLDLPQFLVRFDSEKTKGQNIDVQNTTQKTKD